MTATDPPPFEPAFGWDEADPHPGVQCHEAHPDRAHKIPRPAPPDYNPVTMRTRVEGPGDGRTMEEVMANQHAVFREAMTAPIEPAGQVDTATALALLGSDPWSRFDLWAHRAWELAERSIEAAGAEGKRNEGTTLQSETIYDPRQQNLMDAAKLCADLAQAVCPLAAIGGLPPRLPDLDLTLPLR